MSITQESPKRRRHSKWSIDCLTQSSPRAGEQWALSLPAKAMLFVLDAGYDPAQLGPAQLGPGLDGTRAALLVRPRRAVASTPIRHRPRPAGSAGPAATAPSSTPTTRPSGPPRAATPRDPRDQAARPIVRGTLVRVQVASKSLVGRPAPAHPRCCGCGGTAPAVSIWSCCGGPTGGSTSAGSTWSTPCGLSSRPWAGPLGWTTPRVRSPEQARPLDLARGRRLHPVAPGPRRRH
jgi:hypothetical protein